MSCERCGAPFACGVADAACWCREIEVDEPGRGRLAAAFGDCLCPACLSEPAAGAPEQPGGQEESLDGPVGGRLDGGVGRL